jgi:hypothetical protein
MRDEKRNGAKELGIGIVKRNAAGDECRKENVKTEKEKGKAEWERGEYEKGKEKKRL